MDHHQHNGNIKAALPLYPDVIEKSGETLRTEKVSGDEKNNVDVQVESKCNEVEIACTEENAGQQTLEIGEKEPVDEYEHSLWKWPSGRSCFTKVWYNLICAKFGMEVKKTNV